MEQMIVAFIFDSGRMGTSMYGHEVFKCMLQGKELTRNSNKMVISHGDLNPKTMYRFIDIEPYIIKDDLCTVDFTQTIREKPFKDYPYCWIIEDVEKTIATDLDKCLKKTCEGYIGLSRIDINSNDEKKQFWKRLIRDFTIYNNKITVFQDPDIEDVFCYEEIAKKLGYFIEYNKEAEYISVEESKDKKSTYVKSDNDLKIKRQEKQSIDRNLLEINFDLRKELQISGALIWQSINDIDKIDFNMGEDYLVEFPFFTLYHAAQGLERLQKCIIELICKKEHIKENEKEKVMKLLYSHSHDSLNNWIEEKTNNKFNSNCRNMINILMDFYNNVRYIRYSDEKKENRLISEYSLLYKLSPQKSNNLNKQIKNNFGIYLGSLSKKYYEIYYELCHDLLIFAYELDSCSSANTVYNHSNEVNLYIKLKQTQQAKKELLFWLMKKGKKYPKYRLIKDKALNLDKEEIETYLHDLIYNSENGCGLGSIVGEMYDELCSKNKEKWKKRENLIDYLVEKN
ncbi:MAG: hypothetical protein IJY49_01470 [Clostridia bacterium]|nr:hypothetical protein [Clostridia bacterium]